MKEIPTTTGEITDLYEDWKAQFSGDIQARKVTAKDQFNGWLDEMKKEAAEAAKKKANEMIDKQYWTGK